MEPLLVIVGPTAAGKSTLALELAQKNDGEIICADSRTVYRGMDIGTAKPSKAEQVKVRHHLLDVVDPDQPFTAADFKRLALAAIQDIGRRRKAPILVGGTGLYVDSVLFDYQFSGPNSERDSQNPRHLKRSEGARHAMQLRTNTLVLGLRIPKETLYKRISERVDRLFISGLPDEAKTLAERYGWDNEALSAVGYRELRGYFEGHQTIEETKRLIIKNTQNFAKRQRTWFKRNKSIHWLDDPSEAVDIATTFLNT